MRPDLNIEHVAYALYSIEKFGGGVHEADLIEYLLGERAVPFLDAIRTGNGTKEIAEKLEKMLFGGSGD